MYLERKNSFAKVIILYMSFDVTYFHEIYSREIDVKCLLKYFNIKPSDMKFTVRKIP